LAQHADRTDDKEAFDFLISVVASERLYDQFVDDDGEPIRTMDEFLAGLDDELHGAGSRPTASYCPQPANLATLVEGKPLCQLTTEQRYQLRQAAYAVARGRSSRPAAPACSRLRGR
jgi:hypothetical protein